MPQKQVESGVFPLREYQFRSRIADILGVGHLWGFRPDPADKSVTLVFKSWETYQEALARKEAIADRLKDWGYKIVDFEFTPPRRLNYQRMWELGAFPSTVEFGSWDTWHSPDCDRTPEIETVSCR